jgi:Luciferase
MMTLNGTQEKIVKEVSKWNGVVASPHRFGGTEFRLGSRELGHLHGDYQADIAFPMAVRNQLIAEGKAQPHHILPQSGWITFRFRNEVDVERAVELFKLSYELAKERAAKVAR